MVKSGPIGNKLDATLIPASIACSIAPAIPTVSLGTTTNPSNFPEAIMSSICPY